MAYNLIPSSSMATHRASSLQHGLKESSLGYHDAFQPEQQSTYYEAAQPHDRSTNTPFDPYTHNVIEGLPSQIDPKPKKHKLNTSKCDRCRNDKRAVRVPPSQPNMLDCATAVVRAATDHVCCGNKNQALSHVH